MTQDEIDERGKLLDRKEEILALQEKMVGETVYREARERLLEHAKVWFGFGTAGPFTDMQKYMEINLPLGEPMQMHKIAETLKR